MADDWQRYSFSYPYAGSRWSFDLPATSMEDAEARLTAMRNWGKLDGEIVATIYVPDPRSPWRWLRRLFARA
jgi:hypothetical protein